MTYRWVDHTAEVELEIEAASERGVFEDALGALAELLGVDGELRAPATPPRAQRRPHTAIRELHIDASDRPALLAAWLEELVFLAESEGFVAIKVLSLETTSGNAIRASVAGVVDDPPPLVKAVTYHRLAFERSGAGYVARVVLDV